MDIRVNGYDSGGIKRVWGEGKTQDIAHTRCAEMILEYIARRPDTGPASNWTTRTEE